MYVGISRYVLGLVRKRGVQERARSACGGKMYLMDVGISRYMFGNMAAWQCIDGTPSFKQEIVNPVPVL